MKNITLFILVLLTGCTKDILPEERAAAQPLEELLQGEYHCYRVEYPDGSDTYHFNASVMLELIGDWQTTPLRS